jgi:hypothetical protein
MNKRNAGKRSKMSPFKPQIFIALILLSILGGAGLYFGHIEVTTGCTGGVIALSMKLLENESWRHYEFTFNSL